MTLVAGYDVGGAHLKVALIKDGTLVHVEQVACALWRGLDHLDAALAAVSDATLAADIHAVTMTGELADIFPDRYTGVATLVERLVAARGSSTRFWMGLRGFDAASEALSHHEDVASTNFLATAIVAAQQGDGLLIDMGSTTTDIIALRAGVPAGGGTTDRERLASGELVYTGLTRTPVMAVTTRGVLKGRWQELARDPFATVADVRRLTCDLPEGVDQHATQDGRGISEDESRARFARCYGCDVTPGEEADWAVAARAVAEVQIRSIHDGCLQVLSAHPPQGPMVVVAAGIGERIAAEVARRLDMPSVSFGERIGAPKSLRLAATRYAPAVAVALLAGETHAGTLLR